MLIGEWGEQFVVDVGEGLMLVFVDDEVFNFYYFDNLVLLVCCGVKMVCFSLLCDCQLLVCQMIWFGGGYLELYVVGLFVNYEMLIQFCVVYWCGVVIYVECGGLMYLGMILEVISGECYMMVDIIFGYS